MSSKVAFAVCAHPDDIEIFMLGTLLQLKDAGYEIHMMNLANGSGGTMDQPRDVIVPQRAQEARNAAEKAGAIYHESIAEDFFVLYTVENIARLGSVMRDVKPDVLLIHSLEDYMEDHMIAARLALTASFGRASCNFPANPPRPITSQNITVYHAQPHMNRTPMGKPVVPEMFVDVSGEIDRKGEILAEHKSQKIWLDQSQGMDSYIISMRALNQEVGQMSGRFEYAEGWRRHLHIGYGEADANPIADALGQKVMMNAAYAND